MTARIGRAAFRGAALLAGAACVACGSSTSPSAGATEFTVDITITGSKTHVDHVQVCVNGTTQTCGPSGGFAVGGSGQITVRDAPGTSYVVVVASNQQATSFCFVTSGGSGVFGVGAGSGAHNSATINCV